MANLFPEGYEDEIIEAEDLEASQIVGYRNGLSFDEQLGDFRRDGANKILDSSGIESWKSWIINGIQTERYAHLAYSTDFGIETVEAFRAKTKDEAESILTRQITEFVLADPYQRAEYIEEITYDWTAPDAVVASLTVHGIADVSIDIEAYITRRDT